MAACIKQWLLKRLGATLNLNPDVAGEHLYDGHIYYKLLQSYNYLAVCQKYEKPKDSVSALQKLRELSLWFNMIGVTRDDVILRKIAFKDGTQAVLLLYDLFLALENKADINVVSAARTKEPFVASTDKFHVLPTQSLLGIQIPQQKHQVADEDHCLQLSIAEQKEIADTFAEQQDKIREKTILECFKRRTLARTQLSIKVGSDIQHHIVDQVSARIKFNNEQAKMKIEQATEGDIECTPDEYLYLLRLWRRKANANELRNKKTQSKLLHTLWQDMIKEQTEEFHSAFCNKLLQQSTFEKSLASRLNRIHNTYQMFCENSAVIKSQIEAQQAEYDNYKEVYKVLHEINEEDAEERKRVYELHRRLYDEKIRRRRELVYQICHQTAIELVEFALKCAQYIELNKEDVPRKLILEWKDYFYEGVCRINRSSNDEFSSTVEEESSKESVHYGTRCYWYDEMGGEDIESIILDECMKNLNSKDVHCYRYMTGPWFLEALLPECEIEDPSLMVTGFIIHRLLEAKYPFPAPPQKPDLIEYQLKAILTPFNETGTLPKLKQLLNEYEDENIAVIEMTDVVNYCLNIYKKEKALSKVGVFMRDKTDDTKSDIKKKKDEKKEQPKSKKEKDTARRDSKKGGKLKPSLTMANKAVQVPSEENLLAALGHGRAGLLGKLAFEQLNGGKKLSDIHLINMLIEYLKSLEDITGWVLVNYPMTFQQAALLEYIMEGNMIRIPRKLIDYTKEEDETFSADEPLIDSKLLKLFEDEIENLRDLSLKQLASINKEGAVHRFLGEEELSVDEEIMCEDEVMGEEDLEIPSICKIKSLKELLCLRTSEILPRPNKITYFSGGNSYFTKYISLKKLRYSFHQRSASYNNPHYPYQILDPLPYYETVGIAETITYKKIDSNLLKDITELLMEAIDSETSFTYSSVTKSSSALISREIESGIFLPEEEESFTPYSKSTLSSITGTSSIPDNATSPEKTISNHSALSVQSCKPVGGEAHLLNIQEKEFLFELKDSGVPDLEKFIARKAKEMKLKSNEGEELEEEGAVGVEELEAEEEEEVQQRVIYPGEKDWKYNEFSIPITLQRSLASVWESIEKSYLNNLSQVFRIYRNLDSKLIPYKIYIRKTCERVVNSPDNKQAAVIDFQLMLNYIEAELRSNDDMKAELHCRAFELFNELCEICDERKKIAEDTRREIISQNWVAHQAYTFVNLAITLMQVELDRYMDTLQIFYDYYIASLQKIPVEKKLDKIYLDKVRYPGETHADFEKSVQPRKTKDKPPKLSKKNEGETKKTNEGGGVSGGVSKDVVHSSIPYSIELVLLSRDLDDLPNPAHTLITDSCDAAIYSVKNIYNHYDKIIKNEYQILLDEQLLQKQLLDEKYENGRLVVDKKEAGRKSKRISNRKTTLGQPPSQATKKEKERKTVRYSVPIDYPSNALEGPYNNLLWEWSTALQDELNRILLRIQLIESRFKIDLDELLLISRDVFSEFIQEITYRYQDEIKNVHLLINLFKTAIEEGQIIKPMIVLDKDDFFVDGGTLMYPEIAPPPPTPLKEPVLDYVLSIEQLTNIMEKLNATAPDGILEDSLVLILEDMLVFGNECGYPYLPKGWSELSNVDIRTLIGCLFAESVMIDWKDFLIFGLNVEFPTIDQLLDARNQLMQFDPDGNETIGWNDFQMVFLWFECDLQDTLHKDLRSILMKEFLFKLYSVDNNEMNYSAMLMAFCRDEEQPEGFAKALSLLSGKPFVVTARDLYKCKDQNELDAPYMAEYIIDLLLHNVMIQTEGIVITEEKSFIELNKYEYFLNKLDLDREAEIEEYENEERRKVMEAFEIKERVKESYWASLVPYDLSLAILMYYLHFHPLSCDHVYRQLRIADELKDVYLEKGRWNVIRIYDLLESDLMRNIFSATNVFKSVNIATVVEQTVAAKSHSFTSNLKPKLKYPKIL